MKSDAGVGGHYSGFYFSKLDVIMQSRRPIHFHFVHIFLIVKSSVMATIVGPVA